jgi:hypothetical protein
VLRRDYSTRSNSEFRYFRSEPGPTIFEYFARTRETFVVGTDDLEIRQERLRERNESELLSEGRESERRRLVDSVCFEVDERYMSEVRL